MIGIKLRVLLFDLSLNTYNTYVTFYQYCGNMDKIARRSACA